MFCIALVSFCHMSDKGLFSGISCLTELTNIWSEPSMCQNMSFHIGFDYSLNKSFHYFYTNWTLEDVFAANQRWDFNWFKFNLQITKSMMRKRKKILEQVCKATKTNILFNKDSIQLYTDLEFDK